MNKLTLLGLTQELLLEVAGHLWDPLGCIATEFLEPSAFPRPKFQYEDLEAFGSTCKTLYHLIRPIWHRVYDIASIEDIDRLLTGQKAGWGPQIHILWLDLAALAETHDPRYNLYGAPRLLEAVLSATPHLRYLFLQLKSGDGCFETLAMALERLSLSTAERTPRPFHLLKGLKIDIRMDAPSAINPLELFVPLVEGTRSLKHLILDIRPESVLHSIPGLVDFISKISGSLDTLYIDGDFGESLADVLASQALKRHKLSILTYKGILSDHEQVEIKCLSALLAHYPLRFLHLDSDTSGVDFVSELTSRFQTSLTVQLYDAQDDLYKKYAVDKMSKTVTLLKESEIEWD